MRAENDKFFGQKRKEIKINRKNTDYRSHFCLRFNVHTKTHTSSHQLTQIHTIQPIKFARNFFCIRSMYCVHLCHRIETINSFIEWRGSQNDLFIFTVPSDTMNVQISAPMRWDGLIKMMRGFNWR